MLLQAARKMGAALPTTAPRRSPPAAARSGRRTMLRRVRDFVEAGRERTRSTKDDAKPGPAGGTNWGSTASTAYRAA